MIEPDEINDKNYLTSTPIRIRLFKGTGAQALSQAVQIIIRLTEVPLLLGFWGTQLYGEWLMLSAIPAYLSIGDGGFTTAACRDITIRAGAGDRRGALNVYQSIWILLLLLSMALCLAAVIFLQVAPLHQWLRFSVMSGHEASLVLLLLVIHILLGFQGGLLNGGFWAAARYPTGMSLTALIQLLEFGGMALAVALWGGPVQAALGYLVGRFIGTSLMWIGQKRVSPWLGFGIRHASFSELRRLTAPAFASLTFPLGNALNIQGMRLVVGLVLGPAAVAAFVPMRTLSNLALQPRLMVNRLVEPEMAMAFGKDDKTLFRKLFLDSCRISFWGCLAIAFALIPAAIWIFPWWTGGKVFIDWPTYIFLLLAVLMNGTWFTALMVPYATNRHGVIAVYYSLLYGLGALSGALFLAIYFGLIGPAMALLIAESIMALVVIKVALEMTELNSNAWLGHLLRQPLELFVQGLSILYGILHKYIYASQTMKKNL